MSIANQKQMMTAYVEERGWTLEETYIDDGYSGTTFNRPDFKKMDKMIESGEIGTVIVKDLSRFARNYSDAGSLIDNLFVQMGVRFISLAENVDSYKDPDSVSSIIVPIIQTPPPP